MTYLNKNGTSFEPGQESPVSVASTKGIIPCNVVDRQGMSCFIKADGFYIHGYKFTSLSPELRQLTKSVDSYGRSLVNQYEYLPSYSMYWTDNTVSVNNREGYVFKTLPLYVLESEKGYLTENSWGEMTKNKAYSYLERIERKSRKT